VKKFTTKALASERYAEFVVSVFLDQKRPDPFAKRRRITYARVERAISRALEHLEVGAYKIRRRRVTSPDNPSSEPEKA
jgi:hypothetical protein